jgi:hypothetical protein
MKNSLEWRHRYGRPAFGCVENEELVRDFISSITNDLGIMMHAIENGDYTPQIFACSTKSPKREN